MIDARDVKALIDALKDQSILVRHRAAEALLRIKEQKFGPDQGKWQRWWDKNKNSIEVQEKHD